MKRLIVPVLLIYTVATIAISVFVIKPPKPIVIIHGEPLTTIGPLDILNTLFSAWVIMALLLIICFLAVRKASLIPSGFYNFFEAIIEAMYNFITSLAGEKNGRIFFPVIATFFLYIAFANWMGLTPLFNSVGAYMELHAPEDEWHSEAYVFEEAGGISLVPFGAQFVELDDSECASGEAGDECRYDEIHHQEDVYATEEGQKLGVLFPYLRGINTDLMTPLSFALVSAFFVEMWGIKALGFFRYGSRFVNFKSPIMFFVGLLEFVAECARIISFSARLFGNMLAGEILLFVMTFMVAVASPILVVFYGLEVFVGAIQAFVFGTLTLVFATLAVTDHSDHGDHAEGHEHEGEHTAHH